MMLSRRTLLWTLFSLQALCCAYFLADMVFDLFLPARVWALAESDVLEGAVTVALFLGLALGAFARPDAVYESFYEPLFRGLLSILMLIMGMEAWARLSELKGAAPTLLIYGLTAPLVHGAIGFGAGMIAHEVTGFSAGGVVLLAVMAASSSDISGPPTMRAALPEANPSAYIGTSTGIGTPVAILSIPLWIALANHMIA